MNRVWVIPLNDGEAVEIERLLKGHGETVLLTRQPWGASWAGLEPEVRKRLGELPSGVLVYGVELAGPNSYSAINLDHHRYADEDRSNQLSSLEQVANILDVPLDRWCHLVAANDKAWIPGLLAEGATPGEIEAVRQQDRTAQGIGESHRRQAEVDLQGAERRGGRVFVRCLRGSNAFHSDLLFGTADEWLLAAPDSWSYSGPRDATFDRLSIPEAHWSGGTSPMGYFGVTNPGDDTRRKLYSAFWS